MAILLTNDDGIDAPGIRELGQALAGLETLYVSAPATNKSGVGMGISLGRELRAKKHENGRAGEIRYSLDGTPADATKFGLQHVVGATPPRLVVSGINLGVNLGINTRCSGTIGAAFEAVAAGINALAVSVEYVEEANWEGAKYYARKVVERFLALPSAGEPFVLNLNVPARDPAAILGLVFARHGKGGVRDYLRFDQSGDSYRLDGDWINLAADSNCDAAALAAGYAVLTPLRFEMTDDQRMAELLGWWDGEASLFMP